MHTYIHITHYIRDVRQKCTHKNGPPSRMHTGRPYISLKHAFASLTYHACPLCLPLSFASLLSPLYHLSFMRTPGRKDKFLTADVTYVYDDVTYVYDDVTSLFHAHTWTQRQVSNGRRNCVTYVYDDVTYVYDDVTYVYAQRQISNGRRNGRLYAH